MAYDFEIIEGHIVRTIYTDGAGKSQFWDIYLENVFWGGRISFNMPVPKSERQKILWMCNLTKEEFEQTGEYRAKGPSTGVVAIYTNGKDNEIYFIMFTNREQMYKRFIHFAHEKERVWFTEDEFCVQFEYSVYSEKWKQFPVDRVFLVIDKNHRRDLTKICTENKQFVACTTTFSLESIVAQETEINNSLLVYVETMGTQISFHIGKKREEEEPKYNFIPVASTYYKNKALLVRGNLNANYTLVEREREPIEYNPEFLSLESEKVSEKMYWSGKKKPFFRKRKINLFYEKFSMKAEEGTFEIFEKALEQNNSENYFILDQTSPQWEVLSGHPNVVARYSEKYYKLLYAADACISTEMPSHLNILRTTNPYIKKALLEKKFIFLQHGVTYMKRQGNTSSFIKGKDGEPDFIAVCSEKEADIVSEMLKIPRERCMITGLPIFSTIQYGHIGQQSDDIVTIMLTWKPSEEHMISHFQDSSYYKNTVTIYELLRKEIPIDKIRIVAHPKTEMLMAQTELKNSLWSRPISEALENTKLLITDYSSVAYNCFYQGAGVIFFQPDLEAYEQEVGKLIPKEDEYIGYRLFDEESLKQFLEMGISGHHIDLSVYRTAEFEYRYQQINAFCDGKNVDRIVDFLVEKEIL